MEKRNYLQHAFLTATFAASLAMMGFQTGCATSGCKTTEDGAAEGKTLKTNEQMVGAVAWFQKSGENRALQYQAFAAAKVALDDMLKNKKGSSKKSKASKKSDNAGKKYAVVVDADETIVDNSPFQAEGILTNTSYPVGWKEWTAKAKAKAIPGAVEFLQYADSKGVDVFYITNRKEDERSATLKNLSELGFPMKEGSLMDRAMKGPSGKEERRQTVLKDHEILILVGDNLNDFAEVFEKKNAQERMAAVDQLKAEFGRKFIVLPNPMYGDWESALYEYNFKLTDDQKAQVRLDALEGHGQK